MKKIIIIGAICVLLAVLAGCTSEQADTDNLLNDVKPRQVDTDNLLNDIEPVQLAEGVQPDGTESAAVYDFAVQLLRQSWQEQPEEQKNILISPVSVLLALTMTANGAAGDTLAQMENTFGLPLPRLNAYLQAYVAALPQTEQGRLHVANSIWLKDGVGMTVQPEFLQLNAAYHGAAVYQEPFDAETLTKINDWVKLHTEGMIDSILQQISPAAVTYLINALAFEADWEEPYIDRQVRLDIFTKEGGGQHKVNFMYSTEQVYLQDENTTGFIKYYAGRDYAFVGLLPAVGVRLDDYVAALSGDKLYQLLQNAEEQEVSVAIPRFTGDYELKMRDVLQRMGMVDAFDAGLADFSAMATMLDGQNLFISEVLHKTHIEVDEQGTKAAAVTAVEIECGAMPSEENLKIVELNRPFVYLLIDCREQLPLFIGAVRSVE